MTKLIGIIPAILLALAVPEAQNKTAAKPDDPTETMLIANERALHAALAKADKASFQALVLPEGIWTTREGFVPMALLVNGLDHFH